MEFKDFEKILIQTIKEFKEIKKIGFIGLMGSLNVKRDIDFIITPTKGVKKGEFLKVLCNFLEELDKKMEKSGSRTIPFTYSLFQEEVEYLSKRKEDEIFLHVCSFPDLANKEVIKSLSNPKKILYGRIDNLSKVKSTNLDFYYNCLFFVNCLYSKYPKKLEKYKTHESIKYILKHNNGKINLDNKSNKEIYFKCCDFLDEKAVIIEA